MGAARAGGIQGHRTGCGEGLGIKTDKMEGPKWSSRSTGKSGPLRIPSANAQEQMFPKEP